MNAKTVEPGTIWLGTARERFQVIHVIEDEQGHVWIHYRRLESPEPREYSCWQESFLQRFSPWVN